MSKFVGTIPAVIMIGLAMGAAPARAANHHYHPWVHVQTQADTHAGYATSRELWPWYVASHGIMGKSCGDAFQPTCK